MMIGILLRKPLPRAGSAVASFPGETSTREDS
jgi:hypothetical protein